MWVKIQYFLLKVYSLFFLLHVCVLLTYNTPSPSLLYKILFCTAYSTWILGLPFLWTEGQHWAIPWGYLTSTSRWCPSPQDVGPESPLRTPQPSPPSVLRNKISQMFLKNTNKCTSFIAKISTFTETVKSCTLLKMVTIILGFVFFAFFCKWFFLIYKIFKHFLMKSNSQVIHTWLFATAATTAINVSTISSSVGG